MIFEEKRMFGTDYDIGCSEWKVAAKRLNADFVMWNFLRNLPRSKVTHRILWNPMKTHKFPKGMLPWDFHNRNPTLSFYLSTKSHSCILVGFHSWIPRNTTVGSCRKAWDPIRWLTVGADDWIPRSPTVRYCLIQRSFALQYPGQRATTIKDRTRQITVENDDSLCSPCTVLVY
jgi:hypothetical protein